MSSCVCRNLFPDCEVIGQELFLHIFKICRSFFLAPPTLQCRKHQIRRLTFVLFFATISFRGISSSLFGWQPLPEVQDERCVSLCLCGHLFILTCFAPIDSNIFSNRTLICWMLFISTQGWRKTDEENDRSSEEGKVGKVKEKYNS